MYAIVFWVGVVVEIRKVGKMERIESAAYKINYLTIVPAFGLFAFMLFPLYKLISDRPTFDDYWHAAIFGLFVGYGIVRLLPLIIKLIRGIPAIEMNNHQLAINVKNITIDWTDIDAVDIQPSRVNYLVVTTKDRGIQFTVSLILVLCDSDDLLETINSFLSQNR